MVWEMIPWLRRQRANGLTQLATQMRFMSLLLRGQAANVFSCQNFVALTLVVDILDEKLSAQFFFSRCQLLLVSP